MFGQRKALGVRVVDSQRNINNALIEKKQVGALIEPAVVADKPKPVVNLISKQVKPAKQRVYGGRQCMVPENFAHDIDKYIKLLEETRRIEPNFLKDATIDGRMRGILLDWLIQIQEKFHFAAETFYLSCSILDRIIVPLKVTKHNFQVIGLACILVASKFEETLIPNVHDFVYMGGSFCTIENLFEAERKVLKAMSFRLNFAYPSHFLRKIHLLASSMKEHSKVHEISKILVDISMLDYKSAEWLPSEVAAACVALGHRILHLPCPASMFESIGVSASTAEEKSKLLAARVPAHTNEKGKLQGLRTKYKDSDGLKSIDKYVASLKICSN